MEKKVTIGVPVYNEEKHLKDTIVCLMAQSYKDIEIIVSDNGSTDGSVDIVNELMEQDSRVRLFQHKQNLGSLKNFEFLRDVCETEFFVWIGAHDIISEDYVEMAVNTLDKNEQVGFVFFDTVSFQGTPPVYQKRKKEISTSEGVRLSHKLNYALRKIGAAGIHAVFRTDLIKKIPLYGILGADHLLTFTATAKSNWAHIQYPAFYMRHITTGETLKQRVNRYKRYKIISSKSIFPIVDLFSKHIDVLKECSITRLERYYLSFKVVYHFSGTQIKAYFTSRSK